MTSKVLELEGSTIRGEVSKYPTRVVAFGKTHSFRQGSHRLGYLHKLLSWSLEPRDQKNRCQSAPAKADPGFLRRYSRRTAQLLRHSLGLPLRCPLLPSIPGFGVELVKSVERAVEPGLQSSVRCPIEQCSRRRRKGGWRRADLLIES